MSTEGRIYQGLIDLIARLADRQWTTASGTALTASKILVDASWGPMAEVVLKALRDSPYRGLLLPYHGRGITATTTPMSQWRIKKELGESRGHHWIMRGVPHKQIYVDTNYWKTFVASRFETPMGERGALVIAGPADPAVRMYADHVTSEYPVSATSDGRTVIEWKRRVNRDNHLLDTTVMAAVAASVSGVRLREHVVEHQVEKRKRRVLSFSEYREMIKQQKGR